MIRFFIKLILTLGSASYYTFWGTIFSVLPYARKNLERKRRAIELNSQAVRNLNCNASEKRVLLPKANINLHVVEAGEKQGHLVVLLHGFPETWHCWAHLIPVLAAKGYHVIAPDMRGYNLSDKPAGVDEYKVTKLTSDVEELITVFGHKTANIVAHDWGGVVAWAFTTNYSHIVDKLVVLNAPYTQAYQRAVKKNLSQVLSSWYIFFFQIPIIPINLLKHDTEATAREFLVTNKKVNIETDVQIVASAMAQDGAVESMLNYYKALFKALAAGDPKKGKRSQAPPTKHKTPVLVLWGEEDIALVKQVADASEWFQDFTIRYIPKCSHWVNYDAPDEVKREVVKFFERKTVPQQPLQPEISRL
eukprot:TRINITY_DN6955_c0_g1_i2.p1 TRINITY_DN6955_c0_g1~~TRINITY_DN6955_c0_g1_i2.p1  ORF type:complete len:362 (-),score=81.83 TRINITY_DN6955_c0_g1_i2:19-1104(-)